jgi:hypothetical protein
MVKKTFHCRACQRDQPIENLGKIIPSNKSKRCQSCCDKAKAAKGNQLLLEFIKPGLRYRREWMEQSV